MKKQKVFKTLLLGCGSIGKKHIKALATFENIKLSVISRSAVKEELEKKYFKKKLSLHRDIKELKLKDFDYFIIANITSLHFKSLKYIDQRVENKLILVEKPLFHSYFPYISKKNKIFVAYQLRFHPVIEALKARLKGENAFYAELLCHSDLRKWRSLAYTKSYSASERLGGGVANDLSHELDLCSFLFGKMTLRYAKLAKISKLSIKSEDFAFFSLSRGALIANISLDYFSFFEERVVKVFCKDASYIADLRRNTLAIYKDKEELLSFKNEVISNIYKLHLSILEKELACTLKEGKWVNKIITKAKK